MEWLVDRGGPLVVDRGGPLVVDRGGPLVMELWGALTFGGGVNDGRLDGDGGGGELLLERWEDVMVEGLFAETLGGELLKKMEERMGRMGRVGRL